MAGEADAEMSDDEHQEEHELPSDCSEDLDLPPAGGRTLTLTSVNLPNLRHPPHPRHLSWRMLTHSQLI